MRRKERGHERWLANLAESLHAGGRWLCTVKNFVDQTQKRSFSTQSADCVEKVGWFCAFVLVTTYILLGIL
ncbi:MAG: hypothetical protein WBV78_17460, partial [Roseobacter sp.]